jgi:hypothetical protein
MVPTATVTGLGENAVFVNVDAPNTIEIGLVFVVEGGEKARVTLRVNGAALAAVGVTVAPTAAVPTVEDLMVDNTDPAVSVVPDVALSVAPLVPVRPKVTFCPGTAAPVESRTTTVIDAVALLSAAMLVLLAVIDEVVKLGICKNVGLTGVSFLVHAIRNIELLMTKSAHGTYWSFKRGPAGSPARTTTRPFGTLSTHERRCISPLLQSVNAARWGARKPTN